MSIPIGLPYLYVDEIGASILSEVFAITPLQSLRQWGILIGLDLKRTTISSIYSGIMQSDAYSVKVDH